MASKYVEEAVETYLAANWSDCPVLTENEEQEAPADGSPFLVVQFPVADSRRPPLYTRVYREEGGFRILINVERGGGTTKMRQYGDDLVQLFRDVEFDGVKCRTPTEVFTDDESDRGNYWVGSLVVPYECNHDETGA
jgi:hypothetical protein